MTVQVVDTRLKSEQVAEIKSLIRQGLRTPTGVVRSMKEVPGGHWMAHRDMRDWVCDAIEIADREIASLPGGQHSYPAAQCAAEHPKKPGGESWEVVTAKMLIPIDARYSQLCISGRFNVPVGKNDAFGAKIFPWTKRSLTEMIDYCLVALKLPTLFMGEVSIQLGNLYPTITWDNTHPVRAIEELCKVTNTVLVRRGEVYGLWDKGRWFAESATPSDNSAASFVAVSEIYTSQTLHQMESICSGDLAALRKSREHWETQYQAAKDDNQKLRAAIIKHRSQKADDRCISDDDELYEAVGDGIKCDRQVGSPAEMLKNCERFIKNRCQAGGPWKSYTELEAELAKYGMTSAKARRYRDIAFILLRDLALIDSDYTTAQIVEERLTATKAKAGAVQMEFYCAKGKLAKYDMSPDEAKGYREVAWAVRDALKLPGGQSAESIHKAVVSLKWEFDNLQSNYREFLSKPPKIVPIFRDVATVTRVIATAPRAQIFEVIRAARSGVDCPETLGWLICLAEAGWAKVEQLQSPSQPHG